jgi:hypothetical protein
MANVKFAPDDWFSKSIEEQQRHLKMMEFERWRQWQEVQLAQMLRRQPIFVNDHQPEPKRTGMNYSTAVFLINNNVRALKGTYEDNGTLGIFKTLDATIKKDDLVVVPTSTRHKMTVFKITEVDVDIDMDSGAQVEWVISKIDAEAYKKLLADEADAIAKIKSAELRKKRTDLAEALFKDNIDTLKALPIASMTSEKAAV